MVYRLAMLSHHSLISTLLAAIVRLCSEVVQRFCSKSRQTFRLRNPTLSQVDSSDSSTNYLDSDLANFADSVLGYCNIFK
jgi:hypothetical protein